MGSIRLALFDLDGTLVAPGLVPFFAQVREVFAGFGFSVPPNEELLRHHALNEFFAFVPMGQRASLTREFWKAFDEKKMPLAPPFRETLETLELLRKEGIRTSIVTARVSRAEEVERYLEGIGILPHIEHISTRGPDNHAWEDKSEQIAGVCARFGIPARETCIVGDHPIDIVSGRKANLNRTIAVLSGLIAREVLHEQRPDHIVEHVGEVPALIL